MKIVKLNIFKKIDSKQRKKLYTPGNIRLGMGLYYNSLEKEEYIRKSLSRKLP